MKKNTKELGFKYTGSDARPDYISKEELLEASRDCLSHQIIETDREKLLSVLSKLDARGDNETIVEGKSWIELAKHFFGFLIFNENKTTDSEILLFLKHDAPTEILELEDVVLEEISDDTSRTYGQILNVEPLIIIVELGNVWGYVQTKNGIEDVQICSPTEELYDWKPIEKFSEEPFIRNPDEDKK